LTITSRAWRNEITASGWISHEAPSRVLPTALDLGLDLTRIGGALRVERTRFVDGGELSGTLALLAEAQQPTLLEPATRRAALVALGATARQRDEDVRYEEQLTMFGEAGRTADGSYLRERAALQFGTASGNGALTTARIAHGTIGGGYGNTREQFVVGGFDSPLLDPLYDARRIAAPAYPPGSASGTTFIAYRATVPLALLGVFYDGVTTDYFRTARRSYGAELRQRVPSVAALGTPDVDLLAGIARAVDEPVKARWRYYLSVAVRP
jgi:hypothetical protein